MIKGSHCQFTAEHKLHISLGKKDAFCSDETKAKMSQSHKGHFTSNETRLKISQANKGKVRTEEMKLSYKIAHTGLKQSQEHILNRVNGRKRTYQHHSQEVKNKISQSLLGHIVSEKCKTNVSLANKGNKYSLGRHQTKEAKIKLASYTKEKSSRWLGGITHEPYPFEWNHILKEFIRARDNYECQLCQCHQKEKIGLDIHHIDYNKRNLHIDNLISLCKSCHTKTGVKREYFTQYFKNLIANRGQR